MDFEVENAALVEPLSFIISRKLKHWTSKYGPFFHSVLMYISCLSLIPKGASDLVAVVFLIEPVLAEIERNPEPKPSGFSVLHYYALLLLAVTLHQGGPPSSVTCFQRHCRSTMTLR